MWIISLLMSLVIGGIALLFGGVIVWASFRISRMAALAHAAGGSADSRRRGGVVGQGISAIAWWLWPFSEPLLGWLVGVIGMALVGLANWRRDNAAVAPGSSRSAAPARSTTSSG
jgi:hypothetical protein